MSRGYDFVNVCHWFAERADLILLLFDAHKLDISDEFKAVIERLKGQDDKIRVILNKADQVWVQYSMLEGATCQDGSRCLLPVRRCSSPRLPIAPAHTVTA